LWGHWWPWLVLLSMVVPLAWLLALASRLLASHTAVYLWLYLNNWDWGLLKYASFWYILRDSAFEIFPRYAILVCWSWSAGFLLGAVSRRVVPVNSMLFCLISVLAQIFGVSRYIAYLFFGAARRPLPADPNGPAFALPFYREVFPVIVLAAIVAIPAVWGMQRGARIARSSSLVRTVVFVAAALTLVGMILQLPGFGFSLRPYRQLAILPGWSRDLLQDLVYWPIGYFAVITIGRRWRNRVQAT
jgi:hypothetical protein